MKSTNCRSQQRRASVCDASFSSAAVGGLRRGSSAGLSPLARWTPSMALYGPLAALDGSFLDSLRGVRQFGRRSDLDLAALHGLDDLWRSLADDLGRGVDRLAADAELLCRIIAGIA
jgi:hypothetical protein